MHAVVEDRIGHRPQIKLQLVEPQGKVSLAVALVEHHPLGVDRPALDVGATANHLSHQRRHAVGILQLHIVARVGLMDREDLQHVLVVFLEETPHLLLAPGRRRW